MLPLHPVSLVVSSPTHEPPSVFACDVARVVATPVSAKPEQQACCSRVQVMWTLALAKELDIHETTLDTLHFK